MRNRVLRRILFILSGFLIWLGALGCSSTTAREHIDAVRSSSHHAPAADSMDNFWLDYRSPPERKVQQWEFYYKHCSGDDNKPYDRADFICSDPY
jgi:hypothetical protein